MNSESEKNSEPTLANEAFDDFTESLVEPTSLAAELDPKQNQRINKPVTEPLTLEPLSASTPEVEQIPPQLAALERQKQELTAEIKALQERKNKLLSEQVGDIKTTLKDMVKEGVRELEERKKALQISVEQLERRRERIREEMRTSFAGVSQELAIRVQGFKDYLVGSLQDLATTAEQLELPTFDEWERPTAQAQEPVDQSPSLQFAQQGFQGETHQIRQILEQYRTLPDYYGPPWQLRRTFEPIHAERVEKWFFSQGGRGAIRTMGSRLQNILIASATISVMHQLYGDRCRTLILSNTPERLGEWRRALQDCLGISRNDFGPNQGIVLFEMTDALVQKADRLVEQQQLPLIIIDETEDKVSLSLLQFPLWLAFAPDPQMISSYGY